MISRPLETDVETMLLPMQESMRPAHANMWARPDIPSATSHQLGKPLSTDRRARAWWDHGNREQSWPSSVSLLSDWRANTSGQHSEQRTRTELYWALETSETGQQQRPSVGSKETWVSGEIRLRRTETCGTADIWNHKPDVVFGTIQQGLMEPNNGSLTVFPSLIRARGQKWIKWHRPRAAKSCSLPLTGSVPGSDS